MKNSFAARTGPLSFPNNLQSERGVHLGCCSCLCYVKCVSLLNFKKANIIWGKNTEEQSTRHPRHLIMGKSENRTFVLSLKVHLKMVTMQITQKARRGWLALSSFLKEGFGEMADHKQNRIWKCKAAVKNVKAIVECFSTPSNNNFSLILERHQKGL